MTMLRGYLTTLAIASVLATITGAAHAEGKFKICHGGTLKLLDFSDHIAELRKLKRYQPDTISDLIKAQRKGGAEFFSQQIAYQSEISGSGTYDLRTFHGLYDSKDYLNVTSWTCDKDDFPIAYFIGFRVQEAADGTIAVDRQKGVVNVISLNGVSAKPDGPIKVKIAGTGKVICEDIAKTCISEIFYDNQ